MKKLLFIFGAIAVVALYACVSGNGSSESTPQILFPSGATLNGVAITQLDTLTVGDTLMVPLIATGNNNRLLSLKVANDPTISNLSFPGIAALGTSILFNDSTNLTKGYLYFGSIDVNSVNLVVQYVPTLPSKTAKLTITARSTSTYSPGGVALSVPAKAKK
jgi:hypothetical protein